MYHLPLKQQYFRRALRKLNRPPKRLPRQLYPERVEAQYNRALDEILAFIKAKIDARIKPMLPGLVKYYGRERKDADIDETPRKYYTAFIYAKTNEAHVLHCTHHYLGELSKADALRVERIVDAYFLKERKLPRVAFDRVDFFGEKKDIRVLRPAITKVEDFLPDLKTELSKFRKDDFPEYKPHVTTALDRVDEPFKYYALISKAGIHRTWPRMQRMDADTLGDLADELEAVRLEVDQAYTPEELKKLARLTGKSVEEWNAAQMSGQLRGIVEIDIFGSEPWLAREMGAFVVQNVSLITSVETEYLSQVERVIATSVRAGFRVEEIAQELEERYDVSKSRAALIARDQVGKFNGQLTEARQKDLGIEKYIRRGVGDARERESHLVLNNRTFSWDDPPEVGHPGEDFQCRCWAEPDLSSFYEDDAS